MYSYRTVAAPARVKYAAGACRFLASISPCPGEEKAHFFLDKVRKELDGATHHVYAYRLGWGRDLLARCDDDGEPAGTAGPPLLSVLEKEELTNVVLVVTRYFGGVKLGMGGLVRAYRSSARAAVRAASTCRREFYSRLLITVPYDCLGGVIRELECQKAQSLQFSYGHDVNIEAVLPLRQLEAASRRIVAESRGKAAIVNLGVE